MSATTEPTTVTDVEVSDDELKESYTHHSDWVYIKVAVVLAVLTALEVYASYADWLGRAFVPLLFVLMAVKFVLVVLFFMHLRYDAKIFGRLFWAGFILAVAVYVITLSAFQFFS
jgi:cytochrome c oxidase subunit IV